MTALNLSACEYGAVLRVTCRRCGASLSAPLLLADAGALRRDAQDGRPVVGAGIVVRDPVPVVSWVSSSSSGPATPEEQSPADCLVVHPDSSQKLRSCGADHGCCGSDGCDGPNRACSACGLVVGTARTDCWTELEMRFLPEAVRLVT
jgi:hypothetical protein